MSCCVDKVIEIAKAEVGYLEKINKNNLDDKTANAGNKNYTKYARDLDKIGFFNGRKQGFAWCAVWVCWLFVQAFGVDAAKKLLCLPSKAANNCAAGCRYFRNYFKNKGQLFDTPEVGDIVFFYSSDKTQIAHTALVYKVDKTYVYTIEGNTSSTSGVVSNGGGVFKKKYKLNYSRLAGYGRPKYDASVTPVVKEETKPVVKEETKPVVKVKMCTLELQTLKKGSKGNVVKALQILLIGNGYSCGSAGADGDFGSGTQNAVMKFQQGNKLDADGVVGLNTWKKILGIA